MPRSKSGVEPSPKFDAQSILAGGRHLRLLQEHLDDLHALPAHGNRVIGLDHLVVAHLLAFFNPALRGLRSIEDLFSVPAVRKRLGTPRLPKSSVSDAQRVLDPKLLLPLIQSLRERAGIQPHDTRLDTLTRRLLAADGTFFAVAPRIAWALFNGPTKGNIRLHVQFDVLKGLPEHVTLTDGHEAETQQLREAIRPESVYVLDRGFADYQLLSEIISAKSDFVVRLRESAVRRDARELPLSAADVAAGVKSDRRITLGWRVDRTPELPELRCVEMRAPHRDGGEQTLLLLTNRHDLPAWMIALIYQHRWQIELFFRWLKCMARFEHFFSESREGMTLQVYATLIGMLLIAIQTGARPSKYDYALLSVAFAGGAPLDQILIAAQKRREERQRAAEADRRRRAEKAKR